MFRWSVHATACTQHCTLYRRGTSYLDIGHVVAGQYRQPSNSLSDNLFTHKFARLVEGGVIQGKFVFSIESHTIWFSFHCCCCCWWIALLPTSYPFSPVCTLTLPQYLWHQLSGCTHRQKHTDMNSHTHSHTKTYAQVQYTHAQFNHFMHMSVWHSVKNCEPIASVIVWNIRRAHQEPLSGCHQCKIRAQLLLLFSSSRSSTS